MPSAVETKPSSNSRGERNTHNISNAIPHSDATPIRCTSCSDALRADSA